MIKRGTSDSSALSLITHLPLRLINLPAYKTLLVFFFLHKTHLQILPSCSMHFLQPHTVSTLTHAHTHTHTRVHTGLTSPPELRAWCVCVCVCMYVSSVCVCGVMDTGGPLSAHYGRFTPPSTPSVLRKSFCPFSSFPSRPCPSSLMPYSSHLPS